MTICCLLASLIVGRTPIVADTLSAPSLVISQLKITSSSGQFITLYNAGATALDMSKYQLEYFNNYDLSKATSSRLIALSGVVPSHGYFMVNDSSALLCYKLTVDSVSLGLSSTAGMVEVLAFNQSSAGGSVTPVLQDYVGWSKTAASGAQTLPTNTNAFLERQPTDTQNDPAVIAPGAGSWQTLQPDASNACQLVGDSSGTMTIDTGLNQLLPATEPPATILSADTTTAISAPSLPAADIGLMAPVITELLPNPAGTGNDASDEFIELYNPNVSNFDLSGFVLQVGATTPHAYTFPIGATLSPQSFTAFYSATTGLSLSNTGSQAKLLDPLGHSISATQEYGLAADGQTWDLANGNWHWTTTSTPGAPNIITAPAAKTRQSSSGPHTSTAKSAATRGKVKSAKTTKTSLSAQPAASDTPSTSIHPWTLALIATVAVLYGAYEYRSDLANRIYQLRRQFGARRANRP